jgi:hypothetical protein
LHISHLIFSTPPSAAAPPLGLRPSTAQFVPIAVCISLLVGDPPAVPIFLLCHIALAALLLFAHLVLNAL